jgi:hypothetical protein
MVWIRKPYQNGLDRKPYQMVWIRNTGYYHGATPTMPTLLFSHPVSLPSEKTWKKSVLFPYCCQPVRATMPRDSVARSRQAFTATFTKIHGHLETLHGNQIFYHGHFYGDIVIGGQKIVKALMDP